MVAALAGEHYLLNKLLLFFIKFTILFDHFYFRVYAIFLFPGIADKDDSLCN